MSDIINDVYYTVMEELEELDTIISDEDLGDNEQSESTSKTPRIFVPKKQAVINFGNKCRARFVENDPNIFFEKRSQGKLELVGTESDEGYSNDGYFRDLENIIKYVFSRTLSEKLLHKKEIKDLEEVKDILKLCNADIKVLANEIIDAIKNNEIFAEITEELFDKGGYES